MTKFLPLIWVGIWRKPTRTVLTALAVLAGFTLLGTLGAVDAGFRHARDRSPLDVLQVDARFGTPLPLAYLEQIAAIPGVTAMVPRAFLGGFYQQPRNPIFFVATDERFFSFRPELLVSDAQKRRLAETPNGVLVGTSHANKYGWKTGDQIPLQSPTLQKNGDKTWMLEIVGVFDTTFDPPGTARFTMMNYSYFDENRSGPRGTANGFMARISNPDDAVRISGEIDALFANSGAPTRTMSERTSTENNLQGLGNINVLINGVAAAVLFMLLVLTGNTMSQSAQERMSEFATMKAMGFEGRDITAILIGESLMQCLPAAIIGLLVGVKLVVLSPQNFPRDINPPWLAITVGVLAAVIVALVSSSLPAWRLERRPLTEALRD